MKLYTGFFIPCHQTISSRNRFCSVFHRCKIERKKEWGGDRKEKEEKERENIGVTNKEKGEWEIKGRM